MHAQPQRHAQPRDGHRRWPRRGSNYCRLMIACGSSSFWADGIVLAACLPLDESVLSYPCCGLWAVVFRAWRQAMPCGARLESECACVEVPTSLKRGLREQSGIDCSTVEAVA